MILFYLHFGIFCKLGCCCCFLYNVRVGERDRHWRQEGVPPGGELMIISSFGDDIDPSVEYTSKPVENLPHTNFDNKAIERQLPMSLVHQELDLLLDRIKGVKTVSLSYVCMDIPGAQLSREYYLERIKLFMEESTKPSGVDPLSSLRM